MAFPITVKLFADGQVVDSMIFDSTYTSHFAKKKIAPTDPTTFSDGEVVEFSHPQFRSGMLDSCKKFMDLGIANDEQAFTRPLPPSEVGAPKPPKFEVPAYYKDYLLTRCRNQEWGMLLYPLMMGEILVALNCNLMVVIAEFIAGYLEDVDYRQQNLLYGRLIKPYPKWLAKKIKELTPDMHELVEAVAKFHPDSPIGKQNVDHYPRRPKVVDEFLKYYILPMNMGTGDNIYPESDIQEEDVEVLEEPDEPEPPSEPLPEPVYMRMLTQTGLLADAIEAEIKVENEAIEAKIKAENEAMVVVPEVAVPEVAVPEVAVPEVAVPDVGEASG